MREIRYLDFESVHEVQEYELMVIADNRRIFNIETIITSGAFGREWFRVWTCKEERNE